MNKKSKKTLIGFMLAIAVLMIILLIAFKILIIFKETKMPSWLKNEYYIINLENNNKTLTNEEKNTLITLLNTNSYTIKESDNIKITKIAYQHPFRHESNYYIFFKTSIDKKLPFTLINVTENEKEYVKEHVCFDTNNCEEFNTVRKIVTDNYKWWENNEKHIEYTKIEEPYITETIDNSLSEKYEVVSGDNLSGKIIDITDKYLEIQEDNNDIKLVEINWKSTNFNDYRTKDSLTIYGIEIGDYFLNKQIIKNVTDEN